MKSIPMKNSETAFLRFNREQEGPKKWELTIGHDLSLFETELDAMTYLVKVNPMPYVQFIVTPHFYWEVLIDDVLCASGQAHDETSAIDAATIAHNKFQGFEITSDYLDQS